jgi:enoyl-CoA hydratase
VGSAIAGYSLPALMAIKESVNRTYEASLSEGMWFGRRQLHARFASDDANEGMKAFLEKRKPVSDIAELNPTPEFRKFFK